MTRVLRANETQYNELNGWEYKNSILEFEIDGNGDWITSVKVRQNGAFLDIRDKLMELEEIDYVPIVT